jgi:hypothetical protein
MPSADTIIGELSGMAKDFLPARRDFILNSCVCF